MTDDHPSDPYREPAAPRGARFWLERAREALKPKDEDSEEGESE